MNLRKRSGRPGNLWQASVEYNIAIDEMRIHVGISQKHDPWKIVEQMVWQALPPPFRSASMELRILNSGIQSFDICLAKRGFPRDRSKQAVELDALHFRVPRRVPRITWGDIDIMHEIEVSETALGQPLSRSGFLQLLHAAKNVAVFFGAFPIEVRGFFNQGEFFPIQGIQRKEVLDFN